MLRMFLVAWATCAFAQEQPVRPAEIDPNTKIEGGADLRGSGAGAGAGARDEEKRQTDKSPVQPRDELDQNRPEQDKPISERKPREREDASKGETNAPR